MIGPFALTLIFTGITAAVGFVLLWLYHRWRGPRDAAAARLAADGMPANLRLLPRTPLTGPVRGPASAIDQAMAVLMSESGLGWSPEAAFLAALAVALLAGGGLLVFDYEPLLSLAAFGLGFVSVLGFFVFRRIRRRQQIMEQLPDAIEMLAHSIRAGETVTQGVAAVAATAIEPVRHEFKRCHGQLELGLSMDSATIALAERLPVIESRILAAALMVHQEAGGRLAQALERLARVCRDRLNFQLQFRAATTSGRLSTLVIASAAPLVGVYLWYFQRPYFQQFFVLPYGQLVLGAAIVLQLVGLLWIFRILSADY
jgi:tight adherence protein B